MKTRRSLRKNNKSRRSLRKNNKSRRQKRIRGGAERHHEDSDLSSAYRYIYDYSENTAEWLNEFLKSGDNEDDAEKVKVIRKMLEDGREMMTIGYDKFEELMESE